MPKIPIYNLSTNIQPQSVGSTAVVEIPQSATSGAIASIADTTSKTLNDIAGQVRPIEPSAGTLPPLNNKMYCDFLRFTIY